LVKDRVFFDCAQYKPFDTATLSQDRPFDTAMLVQDRPFNTATLSQDRPFNTAMLVQDRPFNTATLAQDRPFGTALLAQDKLLTRQVISIYRIQKKPFVDTPNFETVSLIIKFTNYDKKKVYLKV
jgi:hypothetical protein